MWVEVKWLHTTPGPDDIPFKDRKYFTSGQQQWLERIGTQVGHDAAYLLVGSPQCHALFSSVTVGMLRTVRWGEVIADITKETLESFIRDWCYRFG